MKKFTTYVRQMTGMHIYDHYNLSIDEQMKRETDAEMASLLAGWVEVEKPSHQMFLDAMHAIQTEGMCEL